MNYCEKCRMLCMERCPVCGGQALRQPEASDYCFLVEKEVMWAEMLIEALADNGVAATHQPVLGVGLAMKTGPARERYQVYVPYAQLEQAKEIVRALFPDIAQS